MFDDDLGKPQFLPSVAAEVIGMPLPTLRSWVQRGHILASDALRSAARSPEKAGQAHRFPLRRLYQFALALEATRIGISPAQAGHAAAYFTDLGDQSRQPGELFRRADSQWINTYLVIEPGDPVSARIIPDDLTTELYKVFTGGSSTSAAIAIIDVGRVINGVRARLGLAPDDPRFPRGVDPRYASYEAAREAAMVGDHE